MSVAIPSTWLLSAFMLIALLPFMVVSKSAVRAVLTPPMTVVDLANSDPNFIVLSTLIKSTKGLAKKLSGPGPFTVFAPSNDAFSTYDLNDLLEANDTMKLRSVLEFHVLEGLIQPQNLSNGQLLDTVEGDPLQVFIIGGSNWQTRGIYIRDSRHVGAKLTGWKAATSINASNGVVYSVGGIFLPPNITVNRLPTPAGVFSGCTEKSCVFSMLTTAPKNVFPCCIQVDAAPRMPPDIFNDTVALAEYIRITQQVSNVVGRGNIVNAPCPGPNYRSNGTLEIDWFEGFKPWCQARCDCGLLKPCKDLHDDPATHTYCSLCGPKYNAPMDLQIMKVVNSPGWPACKAQ